jgi:DNA-binding response OmpR family regulator
MIVALEPDLITRRQLIATAESLGITLTVFNDPKLLIQSLDKVMPSVLIIEPQTAPLSGIALLQEFRSYEDLATIPIVIYSLVPEANFKLTASEWGLFGVKKYYHKSSTSMKHMLNYARSLK